MALTDSSGNVLSNAALKALASTVSQPTIYQFNQDVFETYTAWNEAAAETHTRKKYYAGQVVSGAVLDALPAYQVSTVTSVTPNTGLPAAGGTVVTIVGTNFVGVTGVTFGGTAGTALKKISDTKIKITTPAKAASTVAVVITSASNSTTAAGNVTFV